MEEFNRVNQTDKPKKSSSDMFWKVTTVALIVILAVMAFKGNGQGATGGTVVDNAAPTPSVKVDMEELLDDDAVKGKENAPVTIIEWSDYECPFCVRFYTDTESLIDEQYIKTGKVKLIYRDYPLPFHTNAQKAAEAAECADEQGKYWEMHDLLFEKGVTGGVTAFKQYAKQLGLNTAKFNTCLDTGAMASEVQKDMADGSAAGIQGTPGFLVNGQLISGAQPFSVFQQVIDAALE
ncbi:MAG: thioredoxin domain-containing protein [Nanoarchaeota archaeon]